MQSLPLFLPHTHPTRSRSPHLPKRWPAPGSGMATNTRSSRTTPGPHTSMRKAQQPQQEEGHWGLVVEDDRRRRTRRRSPRWLFARYLPAVAIIGRSNNAPTTEEQHTYHTLRPVSAKAKDVEMAVLSLVARPSLPSLIYTSCSAFFSSVVNGPMLFHVSTSGHFLFASCVFRLHNKAA